MARIERISENEIVFCQEDEVCVNELLQNVLRIANKQMDSEDVKVFVHTLSSYGDLTVEVRRGMTFNELKKDFNAASKAFIAEKKKQNEDWLKTPEGIAYTKVEEQKKKEHDEFVYHDFDELVEALKQIKPCDLTSETTSFADAVKMCEDVMLAMIKAEDLQFTIRQKNQFSRMLRALGCCKYGKAAQKFQTLQKGSSFADMIEAENNIEFPLNVFKNVINVTPGTFDFGFRHCTEGGKESLCGKWLQAQQKAHKKSAERV